LTLSLVIWFSVLVGVLRELDQLVIAARRPREKNKRRRHEPQTGRSHRPDLLPTFWLHHPGPASRGPGANIGSGHEIRPDPLTIAMLSQLDSIHKSLRAAVHGRSRSFTPAAAAIRPVRTASGTAAILDARRATPQHTVGHGPGRPAAKVARLADALCKCQALIAGRRQARARPCRPFRGAASLCCAG